MKKIEVSNQLNMEVYINDYPIAEKIPEDIFDSFLSILESEVSALIEKSERKRRYNKTFRDKKKEK